MMKSLHFSVPKGSNSSIEVQEDIMDNFYPYFHRHKEAQIMWVIKGNGTLVVEQKLFSFNDGNVFYLSPNQSHVFKSNPSEDRAFVHTVSVFFDIESKLAPLFKLTEFSQLKSFLDRSDGGFIVTEELTNNLAEHLRKLKNTERLAQLLLFVRLLEILMAYSEKHLPLTSIKSSINISDADKRIIKAKDFISKNFQLEKLTLDDIARQANLTPQAFCRSFKKHTGLTYITYLNGLRIQQVCKLLVSNEGMNISEAAYQSGFSSLTNFNRVFFSIMACSPREYLKNYRSMLSEENS